MKILGIETSCDETAVAIVDDQRNILSNVLNSQIEVHKKFGGVVPELAARGHIEVLDVLISEALSGANLEFKDIDGFAATSGPGLIGGVIVGMMAAKTLASLYKKPFIAVNHLEAHALTSRLTDDVQFPYLLLLISGGHCQILLAKSVGNYEKLGETIDDSLGEAFDKVAKMLGLPYPGGPVVEKMAKEGDKNRFNFSRPLIDSLNKDHLCNFSFSGLKTAVRREIEKLTNAEFSQTESHQKLLEKDKTDICASFQNVVCEVIVNRLENVLTVVEKSSLASQDFLSGSSGLVAPNLGSCKDDQRNESKVGATSPDLTPVVNNGSLEDLRLTTLVIAGGVAANRYIFGKIQSWAKEKNLNVITPPIALCTDNAAMVAWAGLEKLKLGCSDELNFKPRAKWSL